jgi:hypothetical protein
MFDHHDFLLKWYVVAFYYTASDTVRRGQAPASCTEILVSSAYDLWPWLPLGMPRSTRVSRLLTQARGPDTTG